MMAERVCKWCKYLESIQDKDLEKQLQDYIANLPEEIKVSNEILRQRLEKCNICEFCSQGICRCCGCFVVVRAAKKRMYCPNPQKSKWEPIKV